MCNTPPSPKIFNPRLYPADCHEARQGGVPIFHCCHACATDLPLEDTESTRDLSGGLEQECRRGAEGHSMSPHQYFLPLTKTLGKLETGLWGTELLWWWLPLEAMTFLDVFHPFGILSFYIWGALLILQGMRTGKSVLFCIVQSLMCLFMMGYLLGSPFKRNCERNQTGKGRTMTSIRSITGRAQTQ